jgi:hypothetical protein
LNRSSTCDRLWVGHSQAAGRKLIVTSLIWCDQGLTAGPAGRGRWLLLETNHRHLACLPNQQKPNCDFGLDPLQSELNAWKLRRTSRHLDRCRR